MLLNKKQIADAADIVMERVVVNEWRPADTPQDEDCYVFVRNIKAKEKDYFDLRVGKFYDPDLPSENPEIRATLVALCCCDEQGNKLFTPADIAMLTEKSNAPIERIYDVAQRLNRTGEKQVGDIEKKLEATHD